MIFDIRMGMFFIELFVGALLCIRGRKIQYNRKWIILPILFILPFISVYDLNIQSNFYLKNNFEIAALYYFINFILIACIIVILTKSSFLESIIITSFAYCFQHTAFDFEKIIFSFTSIDVSKYFTPIFYLYHISIYLFLYTVFYFVIGRKIDINIYHIKQAIMWIVLCMASLILVIYFNLIFINKVDEAVQWICYLYDGLCTVLTVSILLLISTNIRLRDDLYLIQRESRQKEEHYKLSRNQLNMLSIISHDVKHIASHAVQADKKEYNDIMDDLQSDSQHYVQVLNAIKHTGNDALDTVITEKSLYCQQHNITLTCMADGSLLNFMSHRDIYTLIGNILDNAIEAVEKISEQEKRIINFSLLAHNHFITISEENYIIDKPKIVNGIPQTTKTDTTIHGFGMQSIRLVVDKYSGNLSIDTDDTRYTISILFSIDTSRVRK